jgi:hemolysin activation/secretion protein
MARGLGLIPELISAAASLAPAAMAIYNDRKDRKELKREIRREQAQEVARQQAVQQQAQATTTALAPVQEGLHSGLPPWFVPAAIAVVIVGGIAIYKLRKE